MNTAKRHRSRTSASLISTLALLCFLAVGCNDDGLVPKYHEFAEPLPGAPGEGGLIVEHTHWLSDFKGPNLRVRAEISQAGLGPGEQIAIPVIGFEWCMNVARAAGGNEVVCRDWDLDDGYSLSNGNSAAMRVPYNEGDQIVDTWINVTSWDFDTGTSITETCRYHDWGNKDPASCDVEPPAVQPGSGTEGMGTGG